MRLRQIHLLWLEKHLLPLLHCRKRQCVFPVAALTNFDAVHNSERGIVFRFGIYLDKLKLPVLHEYDIDVEYDRNIDCKKCVPGQILF